MKIRPLVLVPALLAVIVAAAGTWAWLAREPDGERREEPAAAAEGAYSRALSAEEELSPEPSAEPFRYDIEYPSIGYRTTPRTDAVAELVRRIEAGDARLELEGPRGLLDSLLAALDIDPASQVLVFSATSLQTGNISSRTPRAIYFNDDVYVAWVQGGGPIEIASMDPQLGPVFYTLEHEEGAQLETQTERCLRCHDSLSLTGGGVPRFIVGSGYIGAQGNIVAHEGWILTSQRTPFRSRFGGWYVTGRHGDQVHLGNIVVRNIYELQDLERLRMGNLDSLEGLVDTSKYAAPGSDIVALLVMQHQIDVQNEISRVNYKVRAALERGGTSGAGAVVAELVEPLVEAMLFVGEARLEGPVVGSSEFRERFERRGPIDASGRSLRELDLEGRLMRYPLSYQIYSAAFGALPTVAKTQVYRRLREVLRGEDESGNFAHLSPDDRAAILEILAATKPDFAAAAGAEDDAPVAGSAAETASRADAAPLADTVPPAGGAGPPGAR